MEVIRIEDMHEWAIDRTAPAEPRYKRPKKAVAAPVSVRNHYEHVPPELMKTAKMLLKAAGLDEDDMRPVVILGKNRIEVDPTRVTRLKHVG